MVIYRQLRMPASWWKKSDFLDDSISWVPFMPEETPACCCWIQAAGFSLFQVEQRTVNQGKTWHWCPTVWCERGQKMVSSRYIAPCSPPPTHWSWKETAKQEMGQQSSLQVHNFLQITVTLSIQSCQGPRAEHQWKCAFRKGVNCI